MTTVGNIGQDARKCFKDAFLSVNLSTVTYELKCETGTLAMKDNFSWGLIGTSDTTAYK